MTLERRMCLRKTRHRTRRKALRSMSSLLSSRYFMRQRDRRLNAYHCPFCGFWHLGNTTTEKGKNI